MDLQRLGAAQPDGPARYRVDQAGTRVVILPATCKLGRHSLGLTQYRAVTREGEIHIFCPACAASPAPDHSWRLTTSREAAARAELDDTPYRQVIGASFRLPALSRMA
jgi:hypothetical protein